MKRALSKAWSLFKGFWSFNTEAKVNRIDFWITFVMMIAFSVGLYVICMICSLCLGAKLRSYEPMFLFFVFFCCYLLVFWITLIVFIVRRLKDTRLKGYWCYLIVLVELAPFAILFLSSSEILDIPFVTFSNIYFQLPMLLPLFFCLLPSKAKDSPLP